MSVVYKKSQEIRRKKSHMGKGLWPWNGGGFLLEVHLFITKVVYAQHKIRNFQFKFLHRRIATNYYADAKQSALEIRTSFFFFFFFVMVVANCNASCYWLHVHCSQCSSYWFFIRIQGCICRNVEGFNAVSFETASREAQTPQLSQLVAKCEQILCMTSCEFDERARVVKICCQSRPALCHSQQ